ncbi:MAG TPA: carboxymuconolactone decarboxylase family protein [Parvibaculum sp.]|uniref:carboxymuconolactone decarboxylase family protein n=1 Tax=Parvibaculum sp. TaxID=2024848 RepID=UPI002BA16791|nr:carboxymuconolactone decarboxylase family protein [Parvibaculum sp.]HMM15105.1 carboxymuconolactone decarboxylase family protein [Parvibaculum sp.]
MARIPYPDPANLPEASRKLLETLPPLNIFRMIAGSGASFVPFISLINAYLNEGVLDAELRELVILRVGHLCGSAYELHQHIRVSRTIGMSEARIEAAGGRLPSAIFSEAENAALALADDLVAHVKADKALFDAARAHLGDTGIQELVIIVGVYILVCRYLETFEIELEAQDIEGSGLEEIKRGVGANG